MKKIAKVYLAADEASANENGNLVFDESPARETASAVGLVRAKNKTAAIKILRDNGFKNPEVRLEKWSFPDSVTNDHHVGQVWVMQLPQQVKRKKKGPATKQKKAKSMHRRS